MRQTLIRFSHFDILGVFAHQTTKDYFTPSSLKAFLVSPLEMVDYLKCVFNSLSVLQKARQLFIL
jgi:hypothetical protein